jgi:hypothetical protein
MRERPEPVDGVFKTRLGIWIGPLIIIMGKIEHPSCNSFGGGWKRCRTHQMRGMSL